MNVCKCFRSESEQYITTIAPAFSISCQRYNTLFFYKVEIIIEIPVVL
jgi:hypothetical protein